VPPAPTKPVGTGGLSPFGEAGSGADGVPGSAEAPGGFIGAASAGLCGSGDPSAGGELELPQPTLETPQMKQPSS